MHLILVFVIFMFYVVFRSGSYGMRCYSNHRYGVTMTPVGALVTPAKGVTALTPLGRGVQLAQAIDTPFWCYHNTFVFTVCDCCDIYLRWKPNHATSLKSLQALANQSQHYQILPDEEVVIEVNGKLAKYTGIQ